MSRSLIGKSAFIVFLLSVSSAIAKEEVKIEQGFRLIGYALHVESGRPEICLSFNKTFPFNDRSAIASMATLRESGVRRVITPRDMSVTAQEICFQGLQNKKRYSLVLRGLRSDEGDRLSSPVSLNFVVPDRKAALSFVSESKGMFPRHGRGGIEDVQQKAVNIASAQLTLYRLEDKDLLADVWGHYKTLDLVPSESLTFARENGKVVWQDHLVFGDKPNIDQVLPVPMPEAATLQPGVYFLAASPDAGKNAALHAGLWFLVSDLRVMAMPSAEGMALVGVKESALSGVADTKWQIFSKEKRLIAEGKTDAEGAAFIPLNKADRREAAFLIAKASDGSVDYMDLRAKLRSGEQAEQREGDQILLNQDVYEAGSKAVTVLLSSHRGVDKKEGVLKIVKPDQSVFEEQRFEEKDDGVAFVSFDLPSTAEDGLWRVVWMGGDGAVRTETSLRVSRDGVWPQLEISSTYHAMETDGLLPVQVKVTEAGRPLPWREGIVEVRGARPSYPAFKRFRFGADAKEDEILARQPFLTREDGTAEVRVPVGSEAFDAGSLLFEAKLLKNPVTARLSLPVKTEQGSVGVAMLPDNGPVAENGTAVFQIVAVDSQGARRARDDLSFHIYEEGQRFAWAPSEGHWDYTPQAERRRLGGGRIDVGVSGLASIKWPVTAGHYVLEITDEEGRVRARQRFEAVWDPLRDDGAEEDDKIKLKRLNDETEAVTVLLKEDAFVTLFDAKGEKKTARLMKAGENKIAIKGDEVKALAFFGTEGGWERARLVSAKSEEKTFKFSSPVAFTGGAEASVDVMLPPALRGKKAVVRLLVLPEGQKNTSSFTAMSVGPVVPDASGKAVLRWKAPDKETSLRLVAVLEDEGQKLAYQDKVVAVYPALRVVEEDGARIPQTLAKGDKAFVRIRLENRGTAKASYTYKIAATEGLKIDGNVEGKIVLQKGQTHVIGASLIGVEGVLSKVRLDVLSDAGEGEEKTWPLSVRDSDDSVIAERSITVAPDETMPLPLVKGEKKSGETLWISPVPLGGVLESLRLLQKVEPYTTQELVAWLEAVRLWKDVEGGAALAVRYVPYLDDLRARQNADGGFSFVGRSESSHMGSTAAAVQLLKKAQGSGEKYAEAWLRRKLENAWFEEDERSVRATALLAMGGKAAAALATTGKGDLSVLRYLAESSRGKEVNPQAAAEIALALAQNGDNDEARLWIDTARAGLTAEKDKTLRQATAWRAVAALIDNPLMATNEVEKIIEGMGVSQSPSTLEEASALLLAMGLLRDRYDERKAVLAGSEKKWRGLLTVPFSQIALPSLIQNTSKERLFVSEGRPVPDEKEKSAESLYIQRDLYRLDGSKIEGGASLDVGETFLLMVQTSSRMKKGEESVILSLPEAAGWDVVEVKPVEGIFTSFWSFLPARLSSVLGHRFGRAITQMEVKADDDGFRLAWLMQARQSGVFALPPLSVRNAKGEEKDVAQNRMRVTVR